MTITPRTYARHDHEHTFHGHRCGVDGSTKRYTASGECCECVNYVRAVKDLMIVGQDNRTPEQKSVGKSQRDKVRKLEWRNKTQSS